jgi:hypothetical protein
VAYSPWSPTLSRCTMSSPAIRRRHGPAHETGRFSA